MNRSADPAASDSPDMRTVLSGLEKAPVQLTPTARQQAAVLAFARRACACPPLWVLRHDAVALMTETLRADLGGVGELTDDGRRVNIKVAAADENGRMVDPVTETASLNPATSIVGYALSTANPVVCSSLAAESRFTDSFLCNLGVVGALCVPMYHGTQFAGALGAYTKAEREFTPDEVRFAETISHLLACSVARVEAEKLLQEQRTFASTLLDIVDTLVITLDLEGKLQGMNQACQQLTGLSSEAVRGKPFWKVFSVPEEVDLIRRVLSRSKSEPAPCHFESSLAGCDGSPRRVVWSLKVVRAQDGRVYSMVLTGFDSTRQMEAQTELQQVKKVADKAAKVLKEHGLEEEAADQLRGFSDRAAKLVEMNEAFAGQIITHGNVQPAEARKGLELRRSPRAAYSYRQMIAPMFGDRVPRQEEFFEVECRDISAGGMAFVMNRPPDFQKLVVELGRPPASNQLTAKVVRLQPLERDGEEEYLIGCQFIERVHL
jgi:PAS domain S-box-containing protein